MEGKITKRAVDQLQAGQCASILWDPEIRGFGIRCRRSGAKHYLVKMRVGGRQRWSIPNVRYLVAIGGKADMRRAGQNRRE